jgi:hypothetical protein
VLKRNSCTVAWTFLCQGWRQNQMPLSTFKEWRWYNSFIILVTEETFTQLRKENAGKRDFPSGLWGINNSIHGKAAGKLRVMVAKIRQCCAWWKRQNSRLLPTDKIKYVF